MADPERSRRRPNDDVTRLPRISGGRVVEDDHQIDFEDIYAAWADDMFGDRGLTLPTAGLARCHDLFGLSDRDPIADRGH